MGWQPLVHSTPLPTGLWTVRISNQKKKKLQGFAHFYILNQQHEIGLLTLSRFWQVHSVSRESPYEPYRTCADPDVLLDYCVCDISKPFHRKRDKSAIQTSAVVDPFLAKWLSGIPLYSYSTLDNMTMPVDAKKSHHALVPDPTVEELENAEPIS